METHHIAAYTTTKHFNTVIITDLQKNKNICEINLGKGFAGNVTSIAITGKYLFIVLKYIKTIKIYDL